MHARVFVVLACVLLATAACCRVGAGSLAASDLEDERRSQAKSAGVGYESVVVSPFVLVANGPRDVRDDAERTIVWARDRLRADFFDKEPGKPLTIWVFPDEETYMRGSSAMLGLVPETPYGFYRPCKRALVVNAGYGWGTLVHEMVHAFMDADFPSAPVWMQEGLASLFEATVDVVERSGTTEAFSRGFGGATPNGKDVADKDAGDAAPAHIRGTTNWRLATLQQAIKTSRAPSFHKLVQGSRGDFDGKEGSLYYASARYLLYWMQEERLLQTFYREYRARANAKSSKERGLDVLRDVSKREISDIRVAWEAFVLELEYRRE